MMANRKAQSKAGISANRRGQQMGDERLSNSNLPAKQEEAEANTPALRGKRKDANKFFADESSQQAGSDAATPRSNTPSLPAAMPVNVKKGESGGERVFKERQARKGAKKGSGKE
ncbi:MAG TPA: hypothetical protein VK388_18860 [Pyrinomonadaceae bacterium]|nr:hypothetical protein [Pyrinomonadaceae bacterium]